MFVLGVNYSHHGSVALLRDNEVVYFCLEERLNRIKEWGGPKKTHPPRALDQVKSFTSTIDILVGISGRKQQLEETANYLKSIGVRVRQAKMDNPAHHLFHAAAGFYLSPFDSASCIVVDGAGAIARFNANIKASETTSIYEVDYQNGFRCTHKKYTVGIYDSGGIAKLALKYPQSKNIPIQISESDINAFVKQCESNNNPFSYAKKIHVTTQLDTGLNYYCASAQIGHNLGWGLAGTDGKMMGLSAYGNRPDSTHWQQLAYDTQKELEQDFIFNVSLCNQSNIVMGGGCALNILGNSHIKRVYPNINLYIDPIAHDGTTALGAAAYNFYTITKCKQKLEVTPYTGMNYNITKNEVYELTRKYSV